MGGLANVPGAEAIDPVKMIPAAKVPVLLQFARRDEYISLEQAEKLIAATPEPKLWRIYDGDHGLGDRARADRIAWLLGHFGLPQVPSPDPPRLAPPEVPVPDAPELFWLRIVAERPGSDAVTVRRDLPYHKDYQLDVYLPAPDPEKPPVVVLVHGQAPPSILRHFKDGGPMTSQARYLAARGFAVVVPNLGSAARGAERARRYEGVGDVAKNLDDAIAYVQAHAAELGVDAGKMCLLVFSAGGAYGVATGLTRPGVRGIVAWNSFLTSDYLGPDKQEWSPAAKIRAGSPPVLVVRSQRDFPELNAATETFLAEAGKQGANVTVLDIPDGHHAADLFDDTEDTREVMRKAVRFLVKSVE
jgi:dienelactone hydrolase